jgi:hypothetical protein
MGHMTKFTINILAAVDSADRATSRRWAGPRKRVLGLMDSKRNSIFYSLPLREGVESVDCSRFGRFSRQRLG